MMPLTNTTNLNTWLINEKPANISLNLESSIAELESYDLQADISSLGSVAAQMFDDYPLLPGIILMSQERLVGMLSRRKFLESISRPFGRELFLKRPINSLYKLAQQEILVLSSDTLIVFAASQALQREVNLIYEPVVMQLPDQTYRVLDVHQLLIAQSQIHQLATRLLHQKTQSYLIQTEKLASLGQLLASIAHEIRNPVSCILGNTKFASEYYQDLTALLSLYEETSGDTPQVIQMKRQIDFNFLQQDMPEVIGGITESAKRLSQLVNSLHTFSHIDESVLREADIHECLDNTLLILKNRIKHSQITVHKEFHPVLPQIKCYSGQLGQVFMNIISNAMDALEEYQLKLQAESNFDFKPAIAIATDVEDQSHIKIAIRDNGPGIPRELQARIFDNFFTTKAPGKGTGMGLAISYQIITEKHHGQLNVFSVLGEGTEFTITLPILN
jgi:signal transduction histidine kinase